MEYLFSSFIYINRILADISEKNIFWEYFLKKQANSLVIERPDDRRKFKKFPNIPSTNP